MRYCQVFFPASGEDQIEATTTSIASSVLEGAGLPAEELAAWAEAVPAGSLALAADAARSADFLARGEGLLARLPERPDRSEAERGAAERISSALDAERDRFMRAHADEVYDELTAGRSRALRDEELTFAAAERYPGLTPTRETMAAEGRRRLADRHGHEIAQGLFLSHVLASPAAGAHLVHTMLRPTAEALDRLEGFRAEGVVDFGTVHLSRHGRAALVELRNPRHLNAEDDVTLPSFEAAVDLVTLDPEVEVGVLRGGVVDHPRYAGRRIFGAGLNLTRLYQGLLPFMFFVTRDLGLVNKIYRGLSGPEHRPGEPEDNAEKLWIAASETYAIGGACQLLLVADHVIAERGCGIYLPARKEGIIPGVANLRLPRLVGERIARRAILSGLEFEAGTPGADPLLDEVVEPEGIDGAISARIEALTSSGLVNAAANRKALRVGQEPIETFQAYMATFAREQAYCHLSPALVRNLEEHWNARERTI